MARQRPNTGRCGLCGLAVFFCLFGLTAVPGTNGVWAQTASEPGASRAFRDHDAASRADRGRPPDRASRWRQKRRAKARQLSPPKPTTFERVRRFVAETGGAVVPHRFILDVPTLEVAGVHPVLGGLEGNAGATAGLLYEPPFLSGDQQFTSVEVLGSARRYYGTKVLAGFESDRYVGYGYGRFEHRPREEFYGVGPASKKSNESVFRLDEGLFGGLFGRSFGDRSLLGGHVSYQTNRFGDGTGDLPQLGARFGEALPGVNVNVDYLMAGAFFEFDSRDAPYDRAFGHRFAPTENRLRSVSLEATRGFYLAAEVTHNVDTRLHEFDFTRLTLDLREFIPVDEELMHGFALRQFASFTRSADGQVPFYRLQSIGGTRSLRGYPAGRFHDRNVVLVNAEVRCQVWHWLDMALFADVGQVFRRVGTANLDAPKAGYGLGFRIKKDGQTLGRLDVAHSEEGFTTHLDLGSLF